MSFIVTCCLFAIPWNHIAWQPNDDDCTPTSIYTTWRKSLACCCFTLFVGVSFTQPRYEVSFTFGQSQARCFLLLPVFMPAVARNIIFTVKHIRVISIFSQKKKQKKKNVNKQIFQNVSCLTASKTDVINIASLKPLQKPGKYTETILTVADAWARMTSVWAEKHSACNVYETKSLRAQKFQLSDKFPFWIVSIFECT